MTTHENIPAGQNEPFDGIKENKKGSPPAYFNLLFYGLIVWGILFMGYYLFSGWSSHREFQEKMNAHQQQYAPAQQGGK